MSLLGQACAPFITEGAFGASLLLMEPQQELFHLHPKLFYVYAFVIITLFTEEEKSQYNEGIFSPPNITFFFPLINNTYTFLQNKMHSVPKTLILLQHVRLNFKMNPDQQ